VYELDGNVKSRVQFMNKYKKKFNIGEIKGVMRGIDGDIN